MYEFNISELSQYRSKCISKIYDMKRSPDFDVSDWQEFLTTYCKLERMLCKNYATNAAGNLYTELDRRGLVAQILDNYCRRVLLVAAFLRNFNNASEIEKVRKKMVRILHQLSGDASVADFLAMEIVTIAKLREQKGIKFD